MKVIKRDGRVVEFDKKKITTAIEKANQNVNKKEQVKKKEITNIIDYIEKLDKKRILVEDIQDIIEIKLMEYKHYELAKRYIVYRYNRALVRKQNTTDETILGLIRENNSPSFDLKEKPNTLLATVQRNLIAAEVSKDLSKRLLLPEKISKAHEDGILYFHDTEYFLQPIIGNCLINIQDILENGTVLNNIKWSPPNSFEESCELLTQVIVATTSSEYGELSVELKYLGQYLQKTKEQYQIELKHKYKSQIPDTIKEDLVEERIKKELSSGVKNIIQNLLSILFSLGRNPTVCFILYLDEKAPNILENAKIYEEILNQIKNVKEETIKILYILDENNNLSGGVYDTLTNKVLECIKQGKKIQLLSAKKLKEFYSNVSSPIGSDIFIKPNKKEEKLLHEGKFHQGTVTINLPQIALLSNCNEESFYNLLQERLDLCLEALMCRHYALLGTTSDTSPIHYQNGAISRLAKEQKIDELLKDGTSCLVLGYSNLNETVREVLGEDIKTKVGLNFTTKLLTYLKKTLDKWEKQTGITFQLYQTTNPDILNYFKEINQEIKDAEYESEENMKTEEKIEILQELQDIVPGMKLYIPHPEWLQKEKEWIPFLYENVLYTIID